MILGFKPSEEELASLEALDSSPHWKVYRKILMAAKTEYFNSILPRTETNDIVKHIGLVAGINFAINQLPVIVAEKKRKEKEKLEKATKEKNNGFKRG